MKHFFFSFIFGFLSIFGILGCSSVSYLLQAGKGQFELSHRSKPIEFLLKSLEGERLSPRVRQFLKEVSLVKRYGEKNGLTSTKNYTQYVALERDFVIWAVSASLPLAFFAKRWSFPFLGSFPYLGWFYFEDAKKDAELLKQEGWDVDIRGVRAYSTLGWFKDPVISTMISKDQDALGFFMNIIFHESVHATLYLKNQSYFNESLANFVADRLTLSYLDETRGSESIEKRSYLQSVEQGKKIGEKLHKAYLQLSKLYEASAAEKSPNQKLKEKKEILSSLRLELHFKNEINNATLMQYQTYHSSEKEFEKFYLACDLDWRIFFKLLKNLKKISLPDAPIEDLGPLLKALLDNRS